MQLAPNAFWGVINTLNPPPSGEGGGGGDCVTAQNKKGKEILKNVKKKGERKYKK